MVVAPPMTPQWLRLRDDRDDEAVYRMLREAELSMPSTQLRLQRYPRMKGKQVPDTQDHKT